MREARRTGEYEAMTATTAVMRTASTASHQVKPMVCPKTPTATATARPYPTAVPIAPPIRPRAAAWE